MSMHDLFGVIDDPVTEAARMLAKHDLFVVPGSVLRPCLTTLHILACDADDDDERQATLDLIASIEAAWERATGIKLGAGRTASTPCECENEGPFGAEVTA